MARTEQESDRRRREEKWQACWCCRDQQKACKMVQALAEILDHTSFAEKKRRKALEEVPYLTIGGASSIVPGKSMPTHQRRGKRNMTCKREGKQIS